MKGYKCYAVNEHTHKAFEYICTEQPKGEGLNNYAEMIMILEHVTVQHLQTRLSRTLFQQEA